MRNPDIAVAGFGAIGTLMTALLEKSGVPVLGIHKNRSRMERCLNNGLHVSGYRTVDVPCSAGIADIRDLQDRPDIRTIIIATKTYATEALMKSIPSDSSYDFVVAQNGIDSEECVTNAFPQSRVARMVLTVAATFQDAGCVHMNGSEDSLNHIGAARPGSEEFAREMAELFSAAGLETLYTEDLRTDVWMKAIINAVQNAPAAVHGLKLGELMDRPYIRTRIEGLLHEAIAVAMADGAHIPADFFQHCIQDFQDYRDHEPSMLTDVLDGKRTEIDAINGKIVEKAREYTIPVPFNEKIVAEVKMLDPSRNH